MVEIWSALIQSFSTLLAAGIAIFFAFKLIKKNELERMRVDCVRRLFGFRFGIDGTWDRDGAPMQSFLAAVNEVPYLFAQYPDVMSAFRDLRSNLSSNGNTEKFITALLRTIAKKTDVDFSALGEADLSGIIRAGDRNGRHSAVAGGQKPCR
ncbi:MULTISPECIES: hypothetical protein [Roseomonadaceae]|uniref:Uncharacterized protein n=1 Tax=Falsiroseomonas oleicola TaxID=2801474 RepID=A0ABS6H357_9PROT|nr:hypothetical protein [Roseomonas oleicola]MBU8543110.1 hypothetical protein [Roseomonas oleicola]